MQPMCSNNYKKKKNPKMEICDLQTRLIWNKKYVCRISSDDDYDSEYLIFLRWVRGLLFFFFFLLLPSRNWRDCQSYKKMYGICSRVLGPV